MRDCSNSVEQGSDSFAKALSKSHSELVRLCPGCGSCNSHDSSLRILQPEIFDLAWSGIGSEFQAHDCQEVVLCELE